MRSPGGLRFIGPLSILHLIAIPLAAARPEAAAIIQGAAETYAAGPAQSTSEMIHAIAAEALGEQRARELRARGARMDWDQTLAYALTQTTQSLNELGSGTSSD
jgi:hypothetical protein